jgi:hypothetical protein
MSENDEAASRLGERKAEIRAELAARAKAAEERRLEKLAHAQAREEAKAEAREQAKQEAAERAKARAQASAEAKAAEQTKARDRAEEARARAEAKARSRSNAQPVEPPDLTGRQRLIDAATRLHAEKRSFASLGIREIAVAAALQVGDRLRPMLRQIQRLASRVDPVTVAALEVSAFYAFALANPDAFVVGVREYHGGSPRVRESIAGLLGDVSNEMRDDIAGLGIFPSISREDLEIACKQIVVHLFHLSQDYIEQPEQREYITESSERMIVWMFAGAALGAFPPTPVRDRRPE